jgi:hypothetical protein
MFQVPPSRRRSLSVTVVRSEPQVADGLADYLKRRVSCRVLLALPSAKKGPLTSDVVVIYPDGFKAAQAARVVKRLVGNPTVCLIIVVTAAVERYRVFESVRGASSRLLVLQEPVWPWTIFATIQSGVPKLRQAAANLC